MSDEKELCKLQHFLSQDDFSMLFNFQEQCQDGGFCLDKPVIKRLCELGVVENMGFGKYKLTSFGWWVIETEFNQNPSLPLKTEKDFVRARK